ncbi:MAG: CHASE domain-containing protein, partial [Candidatus Omnitrophota bacterium]
ITDRWGSWYSAYNPLNDRRTGALIAVLGVDRDARDFNLAVGLARFKAIVLVGVICFALLLVFVYWQRFTHALAAGKEGKKMDLFVRWGFAAVVVLLGLTLTVSLFLEFRHSSWEAFETTFLQRAIIRSQSVAQEMERQLDKLDGLRRFLDSQESVDRNAFDIYVLPLVKGAPVRAIEWAPRVLRADHVFYESSARQDGIEGFQLYEKDLQGKKIPILDRDEYFPVYYLEPHERNEAAFGFDLASEPVRRAAMEKSRDTGQPAATPPLELVQGEKQKTGVLIFMPVYAKELPRRTVEQRRKSLKGFVLAVYNADEFLNGVYSRTLPEGLSCLFEDLAAPEEIRVLYRHESRLGTVDWEHPLLKYEAPLNMPGRQWQATIVPSTTFIEKNLSRAYGWILPIGLILTAILAAFLNFLVTSRYGAEKLVWLRTKELYSEKEALHKREEDFHLLLDSTAESNYGIDLQGRCTFCNSACLRTLGYSDTRELIGKNMHVQVHHSYADGTSFPVEKCRIFQAFRKGQGTHVLDEVMWKADGSSFPAEYWS